jgi:hypothetical protein
VPIYHTIPFCQIDAWKAFYKIVQIYYVFLTCQRKNRSALTAKYLRGAPLANVLFWQVSSACSAQMLPAVLDLCVMNHGARLMFSFSARWCWLKVPLHPRRVIITAVRGCKCQRWNVKFALERRRCVRRSSILYCQPSGCLYSLLYSVTQVDIWKKQRRRRSFASCAIRHAVSLLYLDD